MSRAVLTERRDATLLVTLNRPDSLNAFDESLHHDLADALHEAGDSAVRAVVITGAGKAFCAGADLRATRTASPGNSTLRHTFNPNMLALSALDKPVITAINGAAAGAGLALALAGDIRLASSTAKFVPAFVDIGLVPDNGGSFYAVRLLGYARAFEWLATGRRLGAEEALRMGLVSEVTEPLELLSRALAIAAELAEKPGLAVGLTKRLLNQAYRGQLAEQLEAEAALQALAVVAPGRAEARARMVARISGNGGESK
ncbi:enoyl-CoA hydratase/isomerase family protein [Devosia sp. D6-9]|nr:enoyl-CoA hydratase/isomerase family protein [Devosia sp. D6-9]